MANKTNLKAIMAKITRIKNNGAKFQALIVETCNDIAVHKAAHNDIDALTKLIDALPGSTRANAVIKWAEDFLHVTWNKDAGFKCRPAPDKETPIVHYRDGYGVNLECLKISPFEYTVEAEYKGFNLAAEMAKLVDRARKVKDGKHAAAKRDNYDATKDVVPDDMLDAFAAMASQANATAEESASVH